MADYGAGELPAAECGRPPGLPASAEPESPEQESPPDPWYRNRLLLAVWATMVAILIVLIIYGLIQLSHGAAGGPSTTTPSTTPTRSSTPTTVDNDSAVDDHHPATAVLDSRTRGAAG